MSTATLNGYWEIDQLDSGILVAIELSGRGCPAYHLRYDAGSSREEAGEHGVAHLVEHLMFSAGMTDAENYRVWVEERGGYANAFTWLDSSEYHATLPLDGMIDALRFEACRRRQLPTEGMQACRTELDVIDAEARDRRADLNWVWEEELRSVIFQPNDAYSHSTLGDPKTLRSLDWHVVEDFHRRHYAQAAPLIAVAASTSPALVRDCIAVAFSDVHPSPLPPVPHQPFRAAHADRRAGAAGSMGVIAWEVPPAGTNGHHAADLVGDLLIGGFDNRLDAVFEDASDFGFRLFSWRKTAVAVIWWLTGIGPLSPSHEEVAMTLLAAPIPTLADIRSAMAADRVREIRLGEDAGQRAQRALELMAVGADPNRPPQASIDEVAAEFDALRYRPMATMVLREEPSRL